MRTRGEGKKNPKISGTSYMDAPLYDTTATHAPLSDDQVNPKGMLMAIEPVVMAGSFSMVPRGICKSWEHTGLFTANVIFDTPYIFG